MREKKRDREGEAGRYKWRKKGHYSKYVTDNTKGNDNDFFFTRCPYK